MTGQILTANRLSDGAVVYLDRAHNWVGQIDLCVPVTDEAAKQALENAGQRAVKARQVIEPYLIDVTSHEGIVRPTKLKEIIRAQGPSVLADLASQDATASLSKCA